jgi:AcrR family transcriptional regulator
VESIGLGAQPAPLGTSGPSRRLGGRSARVRLAVLDAVLSEIVDVGYGRLSFESVAERAGVHKTTLYRRWPNREALVTDALLAQSERTVPVPDTGTLRTDLQLVLRGVVSNLTSPRGCALARTLLGEAGHTPEIAELTRQFWGERQALVGQVIRRAVDRGELSATINAQHLIESLIGPLYLRALVTLAPLDTDYADQVLDFVLSRAASDT